MSKNVRSFRIGKAVASFSAIKKLAGTPCCHGSGIKASSVLLKSYLLTTESYLSLTFSNQHHQTHPQGQHRQTDSWLLSLILLLLHSLLRFLRILLPTVLLVLPFPPSFCLLPSLNLLLAVLLRLALLLLPSLFSRAALHSSLPFLKAHSRPTS
jgi:hypothetical protein